MLKSKNQLLFCVYDVPDTKIAQKVGLIQYFKQIMEYLQHYWKCQIMVAVSNKTSDNASRQGKSNRTKRTC